MAEMEMMERVARAMAADNGGVWDEMSDDPYAPWDINRVVFRRLARAAIEAMRTPTEAMADDGGAYLDGFAALGDHTVVYAARGTWQTMIDHILEGPAVSTDAALSPSPAGEGR